MAQLIWRCRRGMRELDLLLISYYEQYYPTADTAEQQAFVQLLNYKTM
ncbi:MAG: succinate dehydrogenase assembly factor 2 [Thiotrichaceae bacterium]